MAQHVREPRPEGSESGGLPEQDATPRVAAMLARHRRTLEALSAAQRAALDEAATLVAANLAAMRRTVAELGDAQLGFVGGDAAAMRSARQIALFKGACQAAILHMEQLLPLIERAQEGSALVLGPRVKAALDEIVGNDVAP
jgi:hypothetical protein